MATVDETLADVLGAMNLDELNPTGLMAALITQDDKLYRTTKRNLAAAIGYSTEKIKHAYDGFGRHFNIPKNRNFAALLGIDDSWIEDSQKHYKGVVGGFIDKLQEQYNEINNNNTTASSSNDSQLNTGQRHAISQPTVRFWKDRMKNGALKVWIEGGSNLIPAQTVTSTPSTAPVTPGTNSISDRHRLAYIRRFGRGVSDGFVTRNREANEARRSNSGMFSVLSRGGLRRQGVNELRRVGTVIGDTMAISLSKSTKLFKFLGGAIFKGIQIGFSLFKGVAKTLFKAGKFLFGLGANLVSSIAGIVKGVIKGLGSFIIKSWKEILVGGTILGFLGSQSKFMSKVESFFGFGTNEKAGATKGLSAIGQFLKPITDGIYKFYKDDVWPGLKKWYNMFFTEERLKEIGDSISKGWDAVQEKFMEKIWEPLKTQPWMQSIIEGVSTIRDILVKIYEFITGNKYAPLYGTIEEKKAETEKRVATLAELEPQAKSEDDYINKIVSNDKNQRLLKSLPGSGLAGLGLGKVSREKADKLLKDLLKSPQYYFRPAQLENDAYKKSELWLLAKKWEKNQILQGQLLDAKKAVMAAERDPDITTEDIQNFFVNIAPSSGSAKKEIADGASLQTPSRLYLDPGALKQIAGTSQDHIDAINENTRAQEKVVNELNELRKNNNTPNSIVNNQQVSNVSYGGTNADSLRTLLMGQ